jgi:succinate-semialdehyde dehydrogenase/glutarate-semialdehyde dehydrogenase
MAKMLIAGESCEASDGKSTEIRNPATGEVVDRVPVATRQDVDRAIHAAQSAFRDWSAVPPSQRAEILFRAADIVRNQEKDLARLLTLEQGKPTRESVLEIRRFVHTLEHYAGLAKNMRGGHVPALDDRRYGMIIKGPIGICGAILPWNFPVSLLANKIGPALVTGNTVVVKPADTTPLTDIQVIRILNEAGLPKGVLNIVPGPASVVGETLVQDPRVRKIAFTGATTTGIHVMEVAARNIKRVTLELGGSDPMIVCDDADIDEAVSAAAVGRFFNCGQACLAIKRLYLFDGIYDEFVEKLVSKVQKLKIGNGLDQGVICGPIHSVAQRDKVEAQIQDAAKRGARILTGGKRPDGAEFAAGNFYMPTLLADVDEQSRMIQGKCLGRLSQSCGSAIWTKLSKKPTVRSMASGHRSGLGTWTRLRKRRNASRPVTHG